MSKDLKRVSVLLSKELYGYFKTKADEMGIPYSNLIVYALSESKNDYETKRIKEFFDLNR